MAAGRLFSIDGGWLDFETVSLFRKPNNETVYINTKSNHPPSILKSLPAAINRRISDISCNEEVFNRNKQHYEDALKRSGHNVTLRYADNSDHTNSSTQRTHRSRKRNIIWFNPPFSKNVKTNVGKIFLGLIKKHFPKDHRYHKIFNKKTQLKLATAVWITWNASLSSITTKFSALPPQDRNLDATAERKTSAR